MTDLRAALIEAGGSALADLGTGEIDTWDEDDIARVALDAFLDVLADRADEWDTAAFGDAERYNCEVLDLIAVLRGGMNESR